MKSVKKVSILFKKRRGSSSWSNATVVCEYRDHSDPDTLDSRSDTFQAALDLSGVWHSFLRGVENEGRDRVNVPRLA